jgi:hypothetical protein
LKGRNLFLFGLTVVIIGGIAFFNSCNHFELNSGDQQPKIEEAKTWFESQNISASLLNIPHKELKSGGIDKKLGFELV